MRFVDRVRILVRAGDGGDGHVGWRREKYVPRGGPAGGDGGRGGDVILVADEGLTTLLDLRYRQHYRAKDGRPGRNKCQYGAGGDDLIVRVPVGTAVYLEGLGEPGERPPWAQERDSKADSGGLEMVYVFDDEFEDDLEDVLAADDEDDLADELASEEKAAQFEEKASQFGEEASQSGENAAQSGTVDVPAEFGLVARAVTGDTKPEQESHSERRRRARDEATLLGDLVDPGQELRVAHGGRGGRGNVHFRSSTNRTPTHAEPGVQGEGFWLRLELKLLADVGIVGFPNVGKSTLISRISRARPKVGAYPFTTLVPQLGVVGLPGERSMVVADVPGLIKGASEGRGLGLDFLRHLERTRVLLHLLAPDPGEGRSPLADLDALEAELRAYGSMFDGRPRVVALNKIDTPEGQALVGKLRRRLRARRIPVFPVSAATGEGIPALLEALWRRVALSRDLAAKAAASAAL
ncbi:MAG TPA: GTPase Obg [Nannocystis exedens]|nr:GTPase Obg [Nannocystis exedens]